MSHLNDFFGLQVRIVRELDVNSYAPFKTKFEQWLDQHPTTKAQHPHLYIHKIIFDVAPRHYTVLGIQNRISSLKISVRVNDKQQSYERMRFINHEIGYRLSPGAEHTFSNYENTYALLPEHLASDVHFEEYLATLVMKRLSENDRKVKFEMSASPAPAYGPRLRNVAFPVITKMDFYLNKHVQLTLDF